MANKTEELTEKQRRFCEEYVLDLNAKQAAIRAGYSINGAEVQGHRLLSNANVQGYISHLNGKVSKKLEITRERVLQEMAAVAFFDIRKVFTESGQLLNIKDVDDETAAALASIETFEEFEGYGEERRKTGETRKVKAWDKMRALQDLGKHLGLFTDKIEVTGANGGPIQSLDYNKLSKEDRNAMIAILRKQAQNNAGGNS